MKKFIITFFTFLPIPAILYVAIICMWGDIAFEILKYKPYYYPIGEYGHTYTRLKEAKQTHDVDILFIGSSHTYRGFDPRIFKNAGYKTFNMGSSAQTPIETKLLVDRYIKKLNPKLVIFEVSPEMFCSDGVEASLDIFANDKNDYGSIRMALRLNDKKTYNALIYSFYRQIFNRNHWDEKKVKRTDTYIEGGYVEKQLAYFKNMKFPEKKLIWNKMQFSAFEEIISELKINNIKTIFVQTPMASELYKSYTNKDYFNTEIKKHGIYYNFNEIMTLNDSLYFFDDDHLNQLGVNLFNDKLIDIIKN